MKFRYNELKTRELTETEKIQLKEDGFIGDECGVGYYARQVAHYYKEYELPNGRGKHYNEDISIDITQLVVGCIFDRGAYGKVFEGINPYSKLDNDILSHTFYLVEPTICSATRYDDSLVFDNIGEAIDYYKKLKDFADSL